MDFSELIKQLVAALPETPGVYQYFDSKGTILYVGKAKNLKRRVSSYFTKNHESRKTAILVRKIVDIKHIMVQTESDALLLENNLIKKYRPRYNVLLKDDKTYPWICIKNEPFPRIFYTRKPRTDKDKYYGPFTSIRMVRTLLDLIKHLYKNRTCTHPLTPENISKHKFKECLEFHIGNCLAPCIGKQSKEAYDANFQQVHKIVNGNTNQVLQFLNSEMTRLAVEFRFEEANDLKQRIDLLRNYQSKSTVVNPQIDNVDVYSICDDDEFAYVNFLKVSNGAIIQCHTVEIQKKLDEPKEELLPTAIAELRTRIFSTAPEILVPFEMEFTLPNVKFNVPKIGDKKSLLDMSVRNVTYYQQQKLREREAVNPQRHTNRIMETMRKDLRMSVSPTHIECFDNSNLQGSYPVASCVVFRNGKPNTKEYRHFNIKTVEGINDFASMEEVVYRRYLRLQEEGTEMPQLIVIDGGKGQLSAAESSLKKLDLYGKVTLIGIAKRLEEIYFPEDSIPIYLDKNSETLKVIQNIRDEAHRFGVKFHTQKRSKDFIKSELDNIKGIGDKTKETLLQHFKTIENIKISTLETLAEVVGKQKAGIVKEYFDKSNLEKP